MKKNIIKVSLVAVLALSIYGCSSNGKKDSVASMAKQSVSVEEIYKQSRLDSKGQAFMDVIDASLLEKDYSYKKNEKIKSTIDDQKDEYEKSNPDAPAESGAKDMMDLLKKAGVILKTQREQYANDQYNKKFVTDASLKKLYDAKEGELTSYHVIKLDSTSFDGDTTKMDKAVSNVEKKLAKATKDNVVSIFKELAKTYPGTKEGETSANGEKAGVARSEVDDALLKKIDEIKYMDFTKSAIDIDGTKYFILKTDKGDRVTFEASKEKLKDIQFTKAKESNSALENYLVLDLRKDATITFTNPEDKEVYDAANKQIEDEYNEALKEANK